MSLTELRRTMARLNDVSEPALGAACKAVEKIAAQEGGTVILGRKQRRVKLKAITRIKSAGDTITATVWGTPTGPWVWLNTGASPHLIPRRKPTAKKPRPMKGKGYEHPIQRKQIKHPGTSGSGAWRRVQKRAARVIPEIIGKEIHQAVSSG